MTVICCICQEDIGERNETKKRVAASFVWRNHGLCADCFDRARSAIARAYNQPGQGGASLRSWSGQSVVNGTGP